MKRILTLVILFMEAVFLSGFAFGAEQWDVFEASFTSARKYDHPFVDVEMDVVFKQGEQQWKVPAFWSGDEGRWSACAHPTPD